MQSWNADSCGSFCHDNNIGLGCFPAMAERLRQVVTLSCCRGNRGGPQMECYRVVCVCAACMVRLVAVPFQHVLAVHHLPACFGP